MKRVIIAAVMSLVFFLVLGTGTVLAQVRLDLKFSIPFNFVVGETSLPAGDYIFKLSNPQILLIQC